MGAKVFLQAFAILFPENRLTFSEICLVFPIIPSVLTKCSVFCYVIFLVYTFRQHCYSYSTNSIARWNSSFVVSSAAGWAGTGILSSLRNSFSNYNLIRFPDTKKSDVIRKFHTSISPKLRTPIKSSGLLF